MTMFMKFGDRSSAWLVALGLGTWAALTISLGLGTALALPARLVADPPSESILGSASAPVSRVVIFSAGVAPAQVSFDGRFAHDELKMVDVETGKTVDKSNCPDACLLGFVPETPTLRLQLAWGPREEDSEVHPPQAGVFLFDAATGARQRIDTDSSGAPLVARWKNPGSCSNQWCDNFYDFPEVRTSYESVSRDGTKVAFCANYTTPKVPTLYVKDLSSGKLTKTKWRCPIIRGVESTGTRPPQISDDGRVVHVNGDVDRRFEDSKTGPSWTADRLYFTDSRRSRLVTGWGSMTRDGQTIFLRQGVRTLGKPTPLSAIKMGVYSISTQKTQALSGRNQIYGIDMDVFSAFDSMSRRGRYVVNSSHVIDRKTGSTKSLSAILAKGGRKSAKSSENLVSGNGKALFVAAVRTDSKRTESVRVTGW